MQINFKPTKCISKKKKIIDVKVFGNIIFYKITLIVNELRICGSFISVYVGVILFILRLRMYVDKFTGLSKVGFNIQNLMG